MYILKHTESGEVVATYSKLPGRIDFTPLGESKVFFSPQIGWNYAGYELVEATAPSTTHNSISDAEKLRRAITLQRDERIAAGLPVTLSDGRVITMQTRNDTDFRNIQGKVSQAIVLTLQQRDESLAMRDAHDNEQKFTPLQMLELGELVNKAVSEVYACSWKLKAMDKVPEDYHENKYWDLSFYA